MRKYGMMKLSFIIYIYGTVKNEEKKLFGHGGGEMDGVANIEGKTRAVWIYWIWWHTPAMPELRRLRQEYLS